MVFLLQLTSFSSPLSSETSLRALVVQGESKHFPRIVTKSSIFEDVPGNLNQKLLATMKIIVWITTRYGKNFAYQWTNLS